MKKEAPENTQEKSYIDDHVIKKDGIKRVHVFSKSSNSLAHGIINAFVLINPDTTLKEINKAFPIYFDDYTPGSVVVDDYSHEKIEEILAEKFIKIDKFYDMDIYNESYVYEWDKKSKEMDEISYGIKRSWTAAELNKLKEEAVEYGIVAKLGDTIGSPCNDNEKFSIVTVNGFTPEESEKKKVYEKEDAERWAESKKNLAERNKKKLKKRIIIISIVVLYLIIFSFYSRLFA